MEWARTLRIDAPLSEAVQHRVEDAIVREGISLRFGPENQFARAYALIEGPQGVDPSEFRGRVPDARWFDEPIIALAIEPVPRDALPYLEDALGTRAGAAGVCSAQLSGAHVLLEFAPSVTAPSLVMQLIDVELDRFHGHRRTQLLSPLTTEIAARVAADGLQAAEIGSDRILESLLKAADVLE